MMQCHIWWADLENYEFLSLASLVRSWHQYGAIFLGGLCMQCEEGKNISFCEREKKTMRKNLVFVLFSSPGSFVRGWRSKYGAIHHFLWPQTTLLDSIIMSHDHFHHHHCHNHHHHHRYKPHCPTAASSWAMINQLIIMIIVIVII